jgi:Predicted membrane protein (DUF2178).
MAEQKQTKQDETQMKRCNVIFLVSFFGSIIAGMIIISFGYYWAGVAVFFVGCFTAAHYMNRMATRYKLGDERSEFISQKANSVTFRITFILIAVLVIVLGGLRIEISGQVALMGIIAFGGIVNFILYYYYSKKYS